MFTQTLTRRVLRSNLVDLLTGPHGVDRYTELVTPTWSLSDARAKVVSVRRRTPRSVTLTLAPNAACSDVWAGFTAGQHVNVTVEIDGRRHTRCYSPANAQGESLIELTVSRHDGGLVSTYLQRNATPGMVVGLDGVGGDFVLPPARPRRILFVAGGSGITPVMSMLRTLTGENFSGDVAVIHYARSPEEACYRDELAATPGVRVLYGFTRSGDGDFRGRFDAAHLAAAMPSPDAVYVCGPTALAEAVREQCDNVSAESFTPPVFEAASPRGGRIMFSDSGVHCADDGRPILDQAETAGLAPASGCRMGICHTCTRRKTRGTVKNLITGAMSTPDDQDVLICVSVPVGDVDIAL
ncbi:MAG: ferredoxin reductase [Candidatus Sericytochromatia bacterium]